MPDDQSKCVSVESENGASKRCLPAGSLFACPDIGSGNVNITIPSGASLSIASATYREAKKGSIAELWITTEATGLVPLCNVKACETVSGLNLSFVGPQHVCLSATLSSTSSVPVKNVSVLGSISPAAHVYENTVVARENVAANVKSKKRRLSNANDSPSNDSPSSTEIHKDANESNRKEQDEGEPSQQTLSKRQRKKLAKKKAKELAEAVAFLNKHETKVDSSKNNMNGKTESVASVTKERRLSSGVYVKDIIVGNGAQVKLGRNVSILYEGAFLNGKVFDKSKNRNNPFTFRQGTGEVIKGLEKGLEGMKVGGEREITIPPEQGYGKKGSGKVVPPNSTLVFSVQLVGLGG